MPYFNAVFSALDAKYRVIEIQIDGDCVFHPSATDPFEDLKALPSPKVISFNDNSREIVIKSDF